MGSGLRGKYGEDTAVHPGGQGHGCQLSDGTRAGGLVSVETRNHIIKCAKVCNNIFLMRKSQAKGVQKLATKYF